MSNRLEQHQLRSSGSLRIAPTAGLALTSVHIPESGSLVSTDTPLEVVIMEAQAEAFLHDDNLGRWRSDGPAGHEQRVFLFHHTALPRFRLLTDHAANGGTFNCVACTGMRCIRRARCVQWRDARQVYLLRFRDENDCAVFVSVLVACCGAQDVPAEVHRVAAARGPHEAPSDSPLVASKSSSSPDATAAHAPVPPPKPHRVKKVKRKGARRPMKRAPKAADAVVATVDGAAVPAGQEGLMLVLEKLVTDGRVGDGDDGVELVKIPVVDLDDDAQLGGGDDGHGDGDDDDESAQLWPEHAVADAPQLARVYALPPAEQLTEDVIAETLTSEETLAIASGLFDERSLRFYSALVQFRSARDMRRQRAIAMAMLETFVLPGAALQVAVSPPVRNGLTELHRQLNTFYRGEAFVSRPPRVAADVFERAAAEIRAQVRGTVNAHYKAQSANFKRTAVAMVKGVDGARLGSEQFVDKEDLLLRSHVLLSVGVRDEPGTLRFHAPQPKNTDERKAHINSALAQWMDSGQQTLRRIITLAHASAGPATRNVSMLRSLARIDDQVEAWSTLEAQPKKARPSIPASMQAAAPAPPRQGLPRLLQRLFGRSRAAGDAEVDSAVQADSLVAAVAVVDGDDVSSDESSEFVDINLDNVRAQPRVQPLPLQRQQPHQQPQQRTPRSVLARLSSPRARAAPVDAPAAPPLPPRPQHVFDLKISRVSAVMATAVEERLRAESARGSARLMRYGEGDADNELSTSSHTEGDGHDDDDDDGGASDGDGDPSAGEASADALEREAVAMLRAMLNNIDEHQ